MKNLLLALTMATAMSTASLAQTPVKNVYASSSRLNLELLTNTEQTVQLNRYLFAGYNTLCLPMSLTADQLGDIRAERLAAIHQEGTVLNLYFVECTSEGIQAGIPYLIYSPTSRYFRVKNTDAMDFSANTKTIIMSDNEGNVITFGSSWETIAKVGRYGIPAKQSVTPLESILVRTEADKQFLPTRCGFTWEQQASTASELRIVHASSSEITAIKSVSQQETSTETYDLQGRKVTPSAKGIRIENGRKVVK